jgi:hypothetical protein
MDPIASQAGLAKGVRPILAMNGDLGALMREGRVVAGEVMQAMDGRSLLVSVGQHRVPADSSVDLSPGDRFLARVENTADGTVLRVLGEHGKPELRLAAALKQVLGEDRPVGKLLEDVASKLRAVIDGGENRREAKALFEKLGTHVFLPGASGRDLHALLARSGLDFEALLLAESRGGKAAEQLRMALGKLIKQIMGGLDKMWTGAGLQMSSAQLEKLGGRLLLAMAGLEVGDGAGGKDQLLARLSAEVRARMGAALAAATGGEQRESAMAGLNGLLSRLLGEEGKQPLSKSLLAALLARSEPNALIGNLKAEILMALGEMTDGPTREALTKALAGLESEQLLNLARREFQEGWHLSLPVPDGDKWATAHLFYTEPDEEDDSHGGKEDMLRITVSVDFSRIGPLRGEVGVRDDLVALRLVVTKPEIAQELRGQAEELVERLSTAGRKVRVAVVLASPEELSSDALTMDVRWLKEHHLMDLRG